MLSMARESWEAAVNLLKGLGVTLKQLFAKPFTVQYPEERVVWPDRTRGRLALPRDPQTQADRCTACLLCEKICPNGSIEITTGVNEAGKRRADDFIYHLERCTFCGLCVEICPFDALRMTHQHEIAVRDRSRLVMHLQQEKLAFNEAWRGALPSKKDI
jgi:NADH-quinone oxidoreductase subunit I